jgi:hypothetical protein
MLGTEEIVMSLEVCAECGGNWVDVCRDWNLGARSHYETSILFRCAGKSHA